MLDEVRLRELARDAAERNGMVEKPRRERGLWSFLTWSFFLSQLAVGNAFASGAAQAANSAPDTSTSDGSAQAAASAASSRGSPDFRIETPDEVQQAVSSGTAPVQTDAVHAAEKAGSVEQLDFTSDTGLTSPSVDAVLDLPLVDGVPPLLADVLPPVLETIDTLVEDLGPVLGDVLVPVVETVEDLASVLGPTLDQTLSPVEAIADGVAGALGETLDPVLTTVACVTEGVGDILEPVGGIAGELISLADPVFDTVAPALEPVTTLVAAAEPILDPVLDVAAPVVALVEPVVEPLLQPLAPVVSPVLEILPLNAAAGGLFDGLTGGSGETDAVGSPGGIALAVEVEGGGYELMEAGAYTELGITLHETALETADTAGDLVGNVAAPISDLLDDDHDGNNLSGLLGHLQHEIALRGFGEGLI